MTTAVVTAPVATVEVAPGVTVNAGMTSQERFNVHLKAAGLPTIERPAAPPQFHTDANVRTFEREAARSQPVVTAPRPVVPPQGTPEERARDTSGRFTPARVEVSTGQVVVDETAIEALNKAYRALTPAERETNRAVYQSDLKSIYEGRRLGETLAQWHARAAGNPGSMAPVTQANVPGHEPTPPPQTFTSEQWETGHATVMDKDGWMPVDRINEAGLSGYTLPRLVANQQYRSGVFKELATARTAGITQEQVTAFITAQMRRDGWIK
jgi:hypothetical protein